MIKNTVTGLLLLLALPVQALTVTFSEAELQAKVEQVMPLVRQTLFVTIELSQPVIQLASDENVIDLQLNVKVSSVGFEKQGVTRLSGTLIYSAKDNAFYVADMRVLEIEVDGMPPQFKPQVIQVAEQVFNPVLQSMPVYRLKDDLTQTMVKAVLESIEVQNKQLVATLKVI